MNYVFYLILFLYETIEKEHIVTLEIEKTLQEKITEETISGYSLTLWIFRMNSFQIGN